MNVPPDVVGLDGGDWSSETVLDDMFILTFDFHEVEGVRVATSWMAFAATRPHSFAPTYKDKFQASQA